MNKPHIYKMEYETFFNVMYEARKEVFENIPISYDDIYKSYKYWHPKNLLIFIECEVFMYMLDAWATEYDFNDVHMKLSLT